MLTDSERPAPAQEAAGARGWLRETPFWAGSAVLHLLVVLLLLAVTVDRPSQEKPRLPISIRPVEKPSQYDPRTRPDLQKRPKVLHPNRAQSPAPPRLEVSRQEDANPQAATRVAIPSVLGSGVRVPAAYGHRANKASLVAEGGGEATEEAVRAALEWLRRHQNPDGSWSARDFTRRCRQICVNQRPGRHGDGRGFPAHDLGVTALAVLAFAGHGQSHIDGEFPEYVDSVRRAMRYIKATQVRSVNPEANGRYGIAATGDHSARVYDHTLATLAMAELLAMSRDIPLLKGSVTAATRFCLRAQNPGAGWRYGVQPGDSDTSVTGWMLLALRAAKKCSLDISPQHFDAAFSDALLWLESATDSTGRTGYQWPGDPGSQLNDYPLPYPYDKELPCMTAVNVLCRLLAGEGRRSRAVRRGVDLLTQHPPRWREDKGRALSTVNFYYWYYGAYAVFQYGGKPWRRWNANLKTVLLTTQRRGNTDEDGSWDPIGEWGVVGGRVYATALAAMTLEVYYRLARERPASRKTVTIDNFSSGR